MAAEATNALNTRMNDPDVRDVVKIILGDISSSPNHYQNLELVKCKFKDFTAWLT